MAFTVIPLHNLDLPITSHIQFGDGFVLQETPDWVKNDNFILSQLSMNERESLKYAKLALVSEYQASAIGEKDPAFSGSSRTIQQSKSETAIIANLAFWLVQPSPLCFTVAFHALTWPQPVPQQTEVRTPNFCHPDDLENRLSLSQVIEAGRLHGTLMSIARDNALFSGVRHVCAALAMYQPDLRYSLFWIALEALFGSENPNEIAYKLSQRIAFIVSKGPDEAKQQFKKAKNCYGVRSTIVHGRWQYSPKMNQFLGDTEQIVRDVFLRLLRDPDLPSTFASKDRDKFLEEMVFARYT